MFLFMFSLQAYSNLVPKGKDIKCLLDELVDRQQLIFEETNWEDFMEGHIYYLEMINFLMEYFDGKLMILSTYS